MCLVAAVGAKQQPAAVVEPGEGALDDPADATEAGAVFGLATGDLGLDPSGAELAPVLVVVVAAIGDDAVGTAPRPTDASTHGWDSIQEGEQLGDVVAVAAGERPGKRQAAAVYEEMLLAAAPATVDWAGTGLRAPFFACT